MKKRSPSTPSETPEALRQFHLGTDDPHPAWDAGRAHGPVTLSDHTDRETMHFFTREDVEEVLGDETRFSARCNQ